MSRTCNVAINSVTDSLPRSSSTVFGPPTSEGSGAESDVGSETESLAATTLVLGGGHPSPVVDEDPHWRDWWYAPLWDL